MKIIETFSKILYRQEYRALPHVPRNTTSLFMFQTLFPNGFFPKRDVHYRGSILLVVGKLQ